jgi:hypothetical protein
LHACGGFNIAEKLFISSFPKNFVEEIVNVPFSNSCGKISPEIARFE